MTQHEKQSGETAQPRDKNNAADGSDKPRDGIESAASGSTNPSAGSPKGAVNVPGPSLDSGGGKNPHDGRAHHGFTGDDGEHVPSDSDVRSPSSQPGAAADLSGEQDQRAHGIPDDPAERTTGADTPNEGGIAGAPGGPRESGPIPGEDEDEDTTTGGGQSGNDAQRDPQI